VPYSEIVSWYLPGCMRENGDRSQDHLYVIGLSVVSRLIIFIILLDFDYLSKKMLFIRINKTGMEACDRTCNYATFVSSHSPLCMNNLRISQCLYPNMHWCQLRVKGTCRLYSPDVSQ
jgi:hypothetical protein